MHAPTQGARIEIEHPHVAGAVGGHVEPVERQDAGVDAIVPRDRHQCGGASFAKTDTEGAGAV